MLTMEDEVLRKPTHHLSCCLTCQGGGGVGPGSQHLDWSVRLEEADLLEGGPLLAVAESQLAFAVPAAGKHVSLLCRHTPKVKSLNSDPRSGMWLGSGTNRC